MKLTKCSVKTCRKPYQKFSMTHRACSPACAIELMQQEKEKTARKVHATAKVKARTRSQWLVLAQAAFNAYIRKRDENKLCICCNKPLTHDAIGGGFDCGHYRSIGSAPHLRYDERNAHGQTKQCNRWGSGRAVDYRLGLIQRIGLAEVEALEANQDVRKYTIPDLIAIRAEYKGKLKDLTLSCV